MDWNDWWLMVGGALISGGVGWVFSWSSSRRIIETHAKLAVLMRALEAERVVTFTYDANGNPVGITHQLTGTASGTSSATAELTVERAPVGPNPTLGEDQ